MIQHFSRWLRRWLRVRAENEALHHAIGNVGLALRNWCKFFGADTAAMEEQSDPRHAIEYRPILGEAQAALYDSQAKFILAYGERYSGKSHINAHKLVRHLWRNFNALAVILVGVKNQAMKGGIWEKLQTMILPEWAEGQGLEFSEEKRDDQKNPFLEVTNRFGGWSRVVLVSAPIGEMLRKRIRGYEASFIFVEELTTLDGSVFFDAVTQQVGRKLGIDDVQQYVAATNPEGPSHWVYQRWFVTPLDPETGEYNPDYAKFHLPSAENPIRFSANERERKLFDEYMRTVADACANDEIEADRMLHGKWVDRPSGEAIFKDYYLPSLHSRGDAKQCIMGSTPSVVHVIPVGGVEPLHKASAECWCHPLVEKHEKGKVIIHHAKDLREKLERNGFDTPAGTAWVNVLGTD